MGSIGHTTGVGKRRKTSVAEVSEGNRAGGNENVAGRKGAVPDRVYKGCGCCITQGRRGRRRAQG